MFDFFGMFASPETLKREREWEKEEAKRRMAIAVDWDPDMKWEKELNIRGKSYKPKSLFKVKSSAKHPNDEKNPGHIKLSPSKNFCYYEMTLPKGSKLSTAYGRNPGSVMFDGPVRIPALYERRDRVNHREGWREQPWMSYTPMEYLTLRCGTRFAKGTVVIGGLGMGHQLEEVAKRKQVKKIIVVESSEELVDWVWPQLDVSGREDDIEFIIGDAREEIPELTADSALIDIYRSYGGNEFKHCPDIKKVWVWGSQYAA